MTGRAKQVGQLLAVGLVLALLALLTWKLVADQGGVAADLGQGKVVPAPATTLELLSGDGETLSLESLRGQPVIINFWASWCGPCRDEAPFLERTYQRHKEEGLVVLGIDFNDLRPDARRFVSRFGLTYPVVVDKGGKTIGRWGVTGVPETFFVDRQGRVVGQRIAGPVDTGRFREQFDENLALVLGSSS